jgi:hypothetical protein
MKDSQQNPLLGFVHPLLSAFTSISFFSLIYVPSMYIRVRRTHIHPYPHIHTRTHTTPFLLSPSLYPSSLSLSSPSTDVFLFFLLLLLFHDLPLLHLLHLTFSPHSYGVLYTNWCHLLSIHIDEIYSYPFFSFFIFVCLSVFLCVPFSFLLSLSLSLLFFICSDHGYQYRCSFSFSLKSRIVCVKSLEIFTYAHYISDRAKMRRRRKKQLLSKFSHNAWF